MTAAVSGWALLTWALQDLVGPVAWRISGGIFLLSLVGWRYLGQLVWDGLYVLTTRGRDA